MRDMIRIGGATAAINDSGFGVAQFAAMAEPLDYMVFDNLSEPVLGRLARQKLDNPALGFAQHFVTRLVGPHLTEILGAGTRIITNSGGLNPRGCAEALRAKAAELGLSPRIAVVDGGDLIDRVDLLTRDMPEMFTGAAIADAVRQADTVLSLTAYIGALPIKAALDAGADIVITGRIVDSATTLGALMHEFGWGEDDFDSLAAGTLIGHVIECSTQVTGGTFTDWRDVPDWANIGFPIAECRSDGSAVITKPPGTGGLVSVGTVTEQLLYEVQDVGAYYVPDVVCDFQQVRVEPAGPDRVRLSGAIGRGRSSTYKACLTFEKGWRGVYAIPIVGLEAVAKAERLGEELVKRARALLRGHNFGEFSSVRVEAVGGESAYGTRARPEARQAREAIARIVVEHDEQAAVQLFMDEAAAALMLIVGGTMPLTQSVVRVQHIRSMLVDKALVPVAVEMDGRRQSIAIPVEGGFVLDQVPRTEPPFPDPAPEATETVPLIALAWARSGDKGDLFNLGVIARQPEFLPYITAALDPQAVGDWYGQSLGRAASPPAERQYAPGLAALNFVVRGAMGGGLAANIRFDSCGKGNGQQILDFPVRVPRSIHDRVSIRPPTA